MCFAQIYVENEYISHELTSTLANRISNQRAQLPDFPYLAAPKEFFVESGYTRYVSVAFYMFKSLNSCLLTKIRMIYVHQKLTRSFKQCRIGENRHIRLKSVHFDENGCRMLAW